MAGITTAGGVVSAQQNGFIVFRLRIKKKLVWPYLLF